MILTVLGSGTGVPSTHRSSPAYLVETAVSRGLVDCGSGTLRQLLLVGKSCTDVDSVFVTHTHPDHIGDLIPLIHALKIGSDARRERPLELFGPPGFRAYYDGCVAPVARPPRHFEVRVQELGDGLAWGGLQVVTAPTVHSKQVASVAYRFNSERRSLVISGDCDYDIGLVRMGQHANVMVMDCSFPDALKIDGHCSASECGRIAALAKVEHLLLSHLYPVPPDQETRLAEARAACDSRVTLAHDLMTITV
ncbi:MAG: ribonuclease Z [Gammaproteobacteria bacterium]|nr:ribonuclease Z [Gammaproteobacteria bacterium]